MSNSYLISVFWFFHAIGDRMVHMFAVHVLKVLSMCRETHYQQPPPNSTSSNRRQSRKSRGSITSSSYTLKLRKIEAERGRRHNICALMTYELEHLLSSPRRVGVDSTPLNWTGAALVRGELMVKVIFAGILCWFGNQDFHVYSMNLQWHTNL